MKEKICLIVPPSAFLLDERVFPSLGILKVASSLEAAGIPVEVLDLSGFTNFEEVMKLHALQTDSRIFGITTTTPQMPATAKVVRAIREMRSDAKIIIGGPHPTLIMTALREADKKGNIKGRAYKAYQQLYKMFDVIVAGDGENSIFEAIMIAQEGKKGIVNADNPKGKYWLTNKKYEATPWPARHLVDLETYKYKVHGHNATSLIAQLGCLAPETLIMLADGREIRIADVKVGDQVVSWDSKKCEYSRQEVVKRWEREADDLWELVYEDGTKLLVTSEHPIWTKDGWKKVEEVKEGQEAGFMCNL